MMHVLRKELLTRKIPYSSIADRHVAAAILEGQLPEQPEFYDFRNPFIFRGIWAIACNCWDENPSKRPSALDIDDELDTFGGSIEDFRVFHRMLFSSARLHWQSNVRSSRQVHWPFAEPICPILQASSKATFVP